MKDFDLVVALRVSPFLSPSAYDNFNDKLILFATSLLSFKEATKDLKIKLYAILDRCPPIYRAIIEKYFQNNDFYFITSKDKTRNWNMNVLTFMLQLKYLIKQDFSEFVLFQEDDYFYIESIKPMLEMIQSENVDFLSPYLHPWVINRWKKFIGKKIIKGNIEWIEAPFTTNTFMTKKTVLKEAHDIMRLYRSTGDMMRFIILTKNIKPLRFDLPYYRYRLDALRFLKHIIKSRKNSKFMPNPTIAIHMAGRLENKSKYIQAKVLETKSKAEEIVKNL